MSLVDGKGGARLKAWPLDVMIAASAVLFAAAGIFKSNALAGAGLLALAPVILCIFGAVIYPLLCCRRH